MLYVPDKYAAVVFKGEIVTDLLGRVISFTALHLGVMHDATIWSLGKHLRPTLVGEYGLGDRIYSDPAFLEACQIVTAQANRAARRIIGPKYSGFGWQPHV